MQVRKEEAPLNLFSFEPWFAGNVQRVTVFVPDPFVSEEDIAGYLKKYGILHGTGTKEQDWEGVWTGKRTYWISLFRDVRSPDGLSHPPGYFGIGSETGSLVYPGQPITCRRCWQFGHYARECKCKRCARCGLQTHAEKDCVQCFFCGEYGHVYRAC
ncbi:ZCHC3 protein, partial [Atractosteus spatula]|nr:ZCHC3 protein [Atractosteus spatula]